MLTKNITLTDVPQLITQNKAYLSMLNHDFCFAFSDVLPDKTAFHIDSKVFMDGSEGKLWAWKYEKKGFVTVTKLVVST